MPPRAGLKRLCFFPSRHPHPRPSFNAIFDGRIGRPFSMDFPLAGMSQSRFWWGLSVGCYYGLRGD